VLGTVLAASGFLNDVLPGLSIGPYIGLSLLYGFLVLISPVIFVCFSALSSEGKGTYVGLLLSAGVVTWAVIGQVATVGQMLTRGGLPPLFTSACSLLSFR